MSDAQKNEFELQRINRGGVESRKRSSFPLNFEGQTRGDHDSRRTASAPSTPASSTLSVSSPPFPGGQVPVPQRHAEAARCPTALIAHPTLSAVLLCVRIKGWSSRSLVSPIPCDS
jgi:hypothetical protein